MTSNSPISRRSFLKGHFFYSIFSSFDVSEDNKIIEQKNRPQSRALPKNPKLPRDSTPHPGIKLKEKRMELPDLNQAVIDGETLDQLFQDIEACTEILDVVPKSGPRHSDNESISLNQAKGLLKDKSVRGIQIRYKYDGAEWWDTLICVETGIKIVRIRHDFGE